MVVKRTLSEKILFLLDGAWLEKLPKRSRRKNSRGKSPQDGSFFHELNTSYRTFAGPAFDELFKMLKASFKGRNRPDD
jgi:hypothetical protein